MKRRVAVVGAGWAGLAAAVRAAEAGHAVTVFEMAPSLGGRARSIEHAGHTLDNGQHILIGAYTRTLDVMRTVGVAPEQVLQRTPLSLQTPNGRGFALGSGPVALAFLTACLQSRWPMRSRLSLLRHAVAWSVNGFICDPQQTVQALCTRLAPEPMAELIEPLCVAAMNTAAAEASGAVFLRVLHDALLSGPGASDLLLPMRPLGALFPAPAAQWLASKGCAVHTGARISALERVASPQTGHSTWSVDGQAFDHVILSCSAQEAARLSLAHNPVWAKTANAFDHEPIVTVYLQAPDVRLSLPMLRLDGEPAQFVFDRGQLGGPAGELAFVISAAAHWTRLGAHDTEAAVRRQAEQHWPRLNGAALRVIATVAEKRATFACRPGLARPPACIAPHLWAAGDYVDGPYPATLEGAVRAGEAAAAAVADDPAG